MNQRYLQISGGHCFGCHKDYETLEHACTGATTRCSEQCSQRYIGKPFKALKDYGEHDYRFSHYEEDRNLATTSGINAKYAAMICRHCGNYIKQQVS